MTAQDNIAVVTKTVSHMTHQQKLDILLQMHAFTQQNPAQSRQLLLQNPQLAHALLHLQVIWGMVKQQDIAALQKVRASERFPSCALPC